MMERILGPLPSHMIKKSRSVLNNSITNYAICGLSLLLVLSFAVTGFSPGTPVFSSPQNPTFLKFDQEPLCGCATCKSLFLVTLFLFICLNITCGVNRDRAKPSLVSFTCRSSILIFRQVSLSLHKMLSAFFNKC